MNAELIDLISSQGIFCILFVYLLVYTLETDKEYRDMIKQLHSLLINKKLEENNIVDSNK